MLLDGLTHSIIYVLSQNQVLNISEESGGRQVVVPFLYESVDVICFKGQKCMGRIILRTLQGLLQFKGC